MPVLATGGMMPNRDQLIEDFLNDLFTSGHTKEAVDRLALMTSSGKDLGGWGRAAIKMKLLAFAGMLANEHTN